MCGTAASALTTPDVDVGAALKRSPHTTSRWWSWRRWWCALSGFPWCPTDQATHPRNRRAPGGGAASRIGGLAELAPGGEVGGFGVPVAQAPAITPNQNQNQWRFPLPPFWAFQPPIQNHSAIIPI